MTQVAGAREGRKQTSKREAQASADRDECVRIEAELLGWQMYGVPGARAVLPMLRTAASDFAAPHDRIAAEIARAVEQGDTPTPPAIALRMRDDPGLAEIGGKDYLLSLARAAPAIVDEAYGRARMENAIRLYRQLRMKIQIAGDEAALIEAIASDSPDRGHLIAELHRLYIASSSYAGPRITLVPFDTISLSPSRRDLVRGIIPRVGLTVVWGPPKCGKSFWIFDLSMHVARGVEYRGRRVQQGAVVYCAFEGQAGIEARKAAYAKQFMLPAETSVPFYLQPLRLDLVADHPELIAAIRSQVSGGCPAMIVLDTLNRSIRGSESDDGDMSAYIRAADALREAFQCAVVIVHHCGWEGTRPRGHSSLPGAVEAQIGVKRDSADCIVVEVELAKDGPQGEQVVSRLEVVEVGTDEDGEAIASCVVVPAEPPESFRRGPTLTPRERSWFDDLMAMFAEDGATTLTAPASAMTPVPTLTRDQVREGFKRKGRFDLTTDGALTGAAREQLRKALNDLKDKHKIGMTDRHVWLLQERQ